MEHTKDARASVKVVRGNFRNIESIVKGEGIESVDGVLADLGWNSEQFEGSGKGFSFQKDEPLQMTYGPADEYPFTARDIVNDWSEEVVADVLYAYADERFSRRIARGIKEAREKQPIETTHQLASIVEASIGRRRGKIHPATKTFQALRIAVNDELDALRELIEGATKVLRKDGRLAIITFHSIEDRIVKHRFKELEEAGYGEILTKKPLTPTVEEVEENPRSRSAKLRIFHIL